MCGEPGREPSKLVAKWTSCCFVGHFSISALKHYPGKKILLSSRADMQTLVEVLTISKKVNVGKSTGDRNTVSIIHIKSEHV